MSKIKETNLFREETLDRNYAFDALETAKEFFTMRRRRGDGLYVFDTIHNRMAGYYVLELTDEEHAGDRVKVSGTLVHINDRDGSEREFLIVYTNDISLDGQTRMAEFIAEARKTRDLDGTHICASYNGCNEKVPRHLDIGFDLVTFDAKEYEDQVNFDDGWKMAVWPRGFWSGRQGYKTCPSDAIRYFKVKTEFSSQPLYFMADHALELPEIIRFLAENIDWDIESSLKDFADKEKYGEVEEIAPEEIARSREYLTREWFDLTEGIQMFYYYAVLKPRNPRIRKENQYLPFRSMYESPGTEHVKTMLWGYIIGTDPDSYSCIYDLDSIEPLYMDMRHLAIPTVFRLPIPDGIYYKIT